jgi:hypothetical protein
MTVRLSALRTVRALLVRNIFSASGAHFCSTLSKPQGLVLLEGLGTLKIFNGLIGTRSRGLSAFSIVPQPLRCRVPPPVPVGSRIFTSPLRPDQFWSPPNLLPMGTGYSFPGGKADHSPPTSTEDKKAWICACTPLYFFKRVT